MSNSTLAYTYVSPISTDPSSHDMTNSTGILQKVADTLYVRGPMEWLYILLCPVLLFFGGVGNVLSVIVSFHNRKAKKGIYVYLGSLGVVDNLGLATAGLYLWLYGLTGGRFNLMLASNCFTIFLLSATGMLSAWFLVIISIERFMFVWFPTAASTMCSVAKAQVRAIILTSTFVCLNLIHLYGFYVDNYEGMKFCNIRSSLRVFYMKFWAFVYYTAYGFLPSCIIVVCNSLTMGRLVFIKWMQKQQIAPGGNTPGLLSNSGQVGKTAMKTTIMLVSISLFYVVTANLSILFTVMAAESVRDPSSPLLAVSYFFGLSNHFANFYIYILSAKVFRDDMKKILGLKT